MGDLVVTAAQVGAVDPLKADIRSYLAAVTITKGQAVYLTTSGTVGVADANASGKQQFRGIALGGGVAGQAIDVLHEGLLYGFTLTSLNYEDLVLLSDTAGKLTDPANPGTMEVHCARVVPMADKDKTKVLYIFTRWVEYWT